MDNALILHGMLDKEEYYSVDFPSASNSHWIPWLQKQLLLHDIAAQTPEMPNSWKPDYETWRKEFERYDLTPKTMLIGHSCGAGFIVRWLSEHAEVHVGNVVLVAPSLGIDLDVGDFFDFKIDSGLASRTKKLVIFNSDDDSDAIQQAAETLRNTIKGVQYREFHNYGHFCFQDMKTIEFPELRDELLTFNISTIN